MNLNTINYLFEAKRPKACSDKEILEFERLVLLGGKVSKYGLNNRIRQCELLGFCFHQGIVVGISSIKKPLASYVKGIISKTKIDRKVEDLKYEIGYSYTEKLHREKGISSNLKTLLLKEFAENAGIIFSTTAIKSSQNYFELKGFTQLGNSYDGDNDENIKYYEMMLNVK